MPYTISGAGEGPVPRPIWIVVECDGDHGLLPAPVARFDIGQEHPRDPPARAGWRFPPDGGALCPECRHG